MRINQSSGFQRSPEEKPSNITELLDAKMAMLLVALSKVFKSTCDPSILSDFPSEPAAAGSGRILAHAWSAAVLGPLRLMPSYGASAHRASSDSGGKASCKAIERASVTIALVCG